MSLWIVIALVAGCGEPCDKSLQKMQKCWKATHKKDANPADAAIFMQVCKAERSKFVKCSKMTDCGEYTKCISEAATDPRAVEILKKTGDVPAEGDMAAAPADMPADAPPADMPADAPPADMPADAPPADMPPAPADMPAAPADMPAAPADMK